MKAQNPGSLHRTQDGSPPRSMGIAVWAWLSFFLSLPVLAVLVLPESWIRALSGLLSGPHAGGQTCWFCGMTEAFLAMARGEFREAARHNPASLPLAGLLLANGVVGGMIVIRLAFREKVFFPRLSNNPKRR